MTLDSSPETTARERRRRGRASRYYFLLTSTIVGLVLLATTTTTSSSIHCHAFVAQTTTAIRQSTLSFSRIPTTTTTSTTKITTTTRLQVAKTGGRMIDTEEQFTELVLAKDVPRPVLVFFSAPWCGPCRLTVPVVKDVMKQYSGEIDVVEICTDDLAEVAEEAGVVSIPTIKFYYFGSAMETHSIVGCVAKTVLANAVEKVLEDVEQIRKKQAP